LKSHNTIKILNKISAADYSEVRMEWEEWAVEDSDTGKTVTYIN